MDRLEKELRAREANLTERAEIISGLRVEVSETSLSAQLVIDDLREDLKKSADLLRASQVPILTSCFIISGSGFRKDGDW